MGDRPNTKPLASNEDSDSDNDNSVFGDNNNAVQEINNPSGGTDNEETPAAKSTADSSLSTKSAKSKASSFTTRLTASHGKNEKAKRCKPQSANAAIIQNLKSSNLENLREREVMAHKKEANARMIEAVAIELKAKKEVSLLDIDGKVKLLQDRKKLLDEGTCTLDGLDKILPLPSSDN
jgi:hypothetical protein